MLSPNKINLAARMKSHSRSHSRQSAVLKALAPFVAVALAALVIVAALTLMADGLYIKTLSGPLAVTMSMEEAYADAQALGFRRDNEAARLASLEKLAQSLETYPGYSSDAYGAIYSAASRLKVEILGLSFDMESGVVTISCAAGQPDLAAGYADLLGESFNHIRYDGYTLSGGGLYSFNIKCLLEGEAK